MTKKTSRWPKSNGENEKEIMGPEKIKRGKKTEKKESSSKPYTERKFSTFLISFYWGENRKKNKKF